MPFDPVLDRKYRFVPHETKLYSKLTMSTNIRSAIMDRNAELQKNPGALNDLSFGRLAVSVPELDWHQITERNPDLISPDHEIRNRALAKWLASSESAPYKVR
jgi:hypothetical protein